MKSFRKELWFSVPQRRKIINITRDVENAIYESGIKEGLRTSHRKNHTNNMLTMALKITLTLT